MYREVLEKFPTNDASKIIPELNISNIFLWSFFVSKIEEEEHNFRVTMFVSLSREDDNTTDDINTVTSVRFLAQKEGSADVEVFQKRNEDGDFDGVSIDKKNFVADGHFYVKCIVQIDGYPGSKISSIDFFRPSKCSDVMFDVQGKKIYANKGYLATLSKVFENMFYSDKVDKKEINLDGVDWFHFYKFLQQLHPAQDSFDFRYIKPMMYMAKHFDTPRVADDFEQILIKLASDGHIWIYIQIADEYNMMELLKILMDKMDKEQLRQIVRSELSKSFSRQTKDALLDKALSFDSDETDTEMDSAESENDMDFGESENEM